MFRKTLFLALAALFLMSSASASSIAVNFEDTAALIGPDGAEKIAPGGYEFIFALPENGGRAELYCAGGYVDGEFLYALLGGDGATLTEQVYEMFTLEGGRVLFMQNGLYGAMSPAGEVLVEPLYTQLVASDAGGFLALTTDCYDEEPDGLYEIGADLSVTATGVKTLGALAGFSEGLLPLISAENSLFGYVDATGQWVIRPQFAYAGPFYRGRAVASLSSGFGLIDRTGNWVLTPKYETLGYEGGQLALAAPDANAVVAFDPVSCQERFRVEGENLYAMAVGDLVQVYDDHSTRLYGTDGALIHEGSPLAGYSTGENGQIVLTDGDWGADGSYLLNADGSVAAGPFKALFPLGTDDGRGYYGFIEFDAEAAYSDALEQHVYSWDESTLRYGVVDDSGHEVLPAEYGELYRIGENRLFASLDGTDGVIDLNGEWVYRFSAARE
ncbi:MAG: WG repeat-containing protein [Clostridiales bacterium]|nr:WG repeat-containing protein [Clostridiales bacterium]